MSRCDLDFDQLTLKVCATLWYIKCHAISLYKIWAKSSNSRLNYW